MASAPAPAVSWDASPDPSSGAASGSAPTWCWFLRRLGFCPAYGRRRIPARRSLHRPSPYCRRWRGRRGGQRLAAALTFRWLTKSDPFRVAPMACFARLFRMTVGQPLFLIAPVDVEIRFQTSSRPAPKPRCGSRRFQSDVTRQHVKVGQGDFLPYFCFTGHSRRRALSRPTLRPEISGAKRCCPRPAPPRPSTVR